MKVKIDFNTFDFIDIKKENTNNEAINRKCFNLKNSYITEEKQKNNNYNKFLNKKTVIFKIENKEYPKKEDTKIERINSGRWKEDELCNLGQIGRKLMPY